MLWDTCAKQVPRRKRLCAAVAAMIRPRLGLGDSLGFGTHTEFCGQVSVFRVCSFCFVCVLCVADTHYKQRIFRRRYRFFRSAHVGLQCQYSPLVYCVHLAGVLRHFALSFVYSVCGVQPSAIASPAVRCHVLIGILHPFDPQHIPSAISDADHHGTGRSEPVRVSTSRQFPQWLSVTHVVSCRR